MLFLVFAITMVLYYHAGAYHLRFNSQVIDDDTSLASQLHVWTQFTYRIINYIDGLFGP